MQHRQLGNPNKPSGLHRACPMQRTGAPARHTSPAATVASPAAGVLRVSGRSGHRRADQRCLAIKETQEHVSTSDPWKKVQGGMGGAGWHHHVTFASPINPCIAHRPLLNCIAIHWIARANMRVYVCTGLCAPPFFPPPPQHMHMDPTQHAPQSSPSAFLALGSVFIRRVLPS